MGFSNNIILLRNIISEMRHTLPSNKKLNENLTMRYILSQFRKHQLTDQQYCKANEEMKFMATSYLCYLRSGRLQKKISAEFHGKGERTVSETAKMVGFKLPHDPK
ncbi:protein FMC1 homolog isoform X2 [Onthophagus taurus]|uniref:protein FMC1 homolog isoform X2 n=1 Tax=Onthophagus taurus TaxID=166361 RepID=UPI000C1FF0D8|nr:protein FMC1 homolog isoform X2 [Onthophagus taurus]XP_022899882.1 protein FMC1 homolog isoform X2 [Onthophagus taurus]